MPLFAQVDHGLVTGTLSADHAPSEDTWPDGRIFVDISDRPLRPALQPYDPVTDTFGTPPAIASPAVVPTPIDETLQQILARLDQLQKGSA